MFASLPKTAYEFMEWDWAQIETYFNDLNARTLTTDNVATWLSDWSRLEDLLNERYARLYVATTQDTREHEAEQRYHAFLENIVPRAESAEQKLKQKLLDSGLEPEGFHVPLQKMRTEADLFREANLPLMTDERKLASAYNKIVGAQTVEWEGKEVTIQQMRPVYQEPDRGVRERAWRLASDRQLADREPINTLWQKFMDVRRQLAANADFPNYLEYRWQQLLRFDYSPDNCKEFHLAIEDVVVPAASRAYERRRRRLGLYSLRPWDLDVDPLGRPPLRPFRSTEELKNKTSAIFHRVDRQLGDYFDSMRRENLLDLDSRKGKGPGGYCINFPVVQRPFIFMNAVGVHDDLRTVLHEAGHAFHNFERTRLPYAPQRQVGAEFSEVASMAMELLSAPYLPAREGGFYTDEEAARGRIEHLEHILCFWPYMAVVDAFQHWIYTNQAEASDPDRCDARWSELWDRFMPDVDWAGLEDAKVTGWHRKLHIYRYPFYYVEYGLAQLGAVQVWRNALEDQAGAVASYRQALALGGTRSLPELFAAAGAHFAFDAETLREAVDLIEQTIANLEER